MTASLVAAATVAAAGAAYAQDPPAADAEEPVSVVGQDSSDGGAEEPSAAAAEEPAGAGQAAAGVAQETSPPSAEGATGAPPYTVECGPDPEEGGRTVCLVDRGTYVGWRTFHAICHTCHAQDAVGSTFAPDLLARMREIDKPTFMRSLDQGFEGQMGVMPAWNQDPNVNKYYEELWSYLSARADGVLLPGRPKRLRDAP